LGKIRALCFTQGARFIFEWHFQQGVFYMSLSKLVFATIAFAAGAAAQDYCSLVVEVVNSGNIRVFGEVPVMVEEPSGRLEWRVAKDGIVEFCDLGIQPVTVKVGRRAGSCGYTVVQGVATGWRHPRRIKVVYEDGPCYEDPPVNSGCSLLLRVAGEGNQWITGVTFSPPLAQRPQLTSDAYGRMMLIIAKGEVIHSQLHKDDYSDEPLDISCSSYFEKEQVITLRRAP
jgi:hypothetical protein